MFGDTGSESKLSSWLAAVAARVRARHKWLSGLRWGLVTALTAYVAVALWNLGWTAIWAALPRDWTFYAVAVVLFTVQPIADVIIYRRLWGIGSVLGPMVMLRKRFFNLMIIDYSGEGWLFTWARRHMPNQDAFILHTIKDSNLLSASASLLVLIALIAGLVAAGPRQVSLPAHDIVAIGSLCVVSVLPVLGYLMVRQRMTVLSVSDLTFVFTVHLVRAILNNALAVLLWARGLPEAPFIALLELLALRLLVSRVPFLGNRDLVFLGTGLGLAAAIDLPQAGIAAVLLAAFAMDQLLNLASVGVPSLVGAARELFKSLDAKTDQNEEQSQRPR